MMLVSLRMNLYVHSSSMLVCCYRNWHTWYEDLLCSVQIVVLHFKSLEGRGSSVNHISADNCWGVA